MNKSPFFSICIPAYKRLDYLKRLLDSITIQTYKDFEVIITDDSPGSEVEEFCKQYAQIYTIKYQKNQAALGTPQNWNEAIKLASGQWIKLMHDDDWFSSNESLQMFYKNVVNYPEANFFFSDYCNCYLQKGIKNTVNLSAIRKYLLNKNPATLFSKNVIGPPSVTLHKNDRNIFYDAKTKWVVDIDFYIQYLKNNKPQHINQVLVNVGIGEEQVTQDCFRKREVEIPENFYLLNKIGISQLRNIFIYDAWWRLIRNLEIKKTEDIYVAGHSGQIPKAVISMISWQSKISSSLLKIGIISKAFMLLNYLFNFNRIAID